jgi:hypothetical protein
LSFLDKAQKFGLDALSKGSNFLSGAEGSGGAVIYYHQVEHQLD